MENLIWFYGLATSVKLLLVPTYFSTDFEVHRHWLSLTHSLPLARWYSDETSIWTLDYPPFFALFELFLSNFAHLIDPQITDLQNGSNYNANSVIYFQRLSVIVSDLVLTYAVHRLTSNMKDSKTRSLLWVLVVWSPGLMIVDHIHFQYNGFLLGLLMLSISYLEEGRDLVGGFLFAVLLCFKHLFAVAAPLYFVYLLRHYCRKRVMIRLPAMGALVVAVFATAYGPFIYHGQMRWVITRMFPFGRGLCHAYWAPNFWVFYVLLDKILGFVLQKIGFNITIPKAVFTGGLVGYSSPFAVLPQITPFITLIVVLLALSPCLFMAWKNPQPRSIARWVGYAYTCGFMFGWHVHEKASLHFVIPLAIVAVQGLDDATHYFFLSLASGYSLFPLLYEAREYPIKVSLMLLHSVLTWHGFSGLFGSSNRVASSKRSTNAWTKTKETVSSFSQSCGCVGRLYICGLVMVELWGQVLHPYFLGNKYPFVPLVLISLYCAIGIMYSWLWQLRKILSST